jgi:hypothetical protein
VLVCRNVLGEENKRRFSGSSNITMQSMGGRQSSQTKQIREIHITVSGATLEWVKTVSDI